jgi:hypothetical protein
MVTPQIGEAVSSAYAAENAIEAITHNAVADANPK